MVNSLTNEIFSLFRHKLSKLKENNTAGRWTDMRNNKQLTRARKKNQENIRIAMFCFIKNIWDKLFGYHITFKIYWPCKVQKYRCKKVFWSYFS